MFLTKLAIQRLPTCVEKLVALLHLQTCVRKLSLCSTEKNKSFIHTSQFYNLTKNGMSIGNPGFYRHRRYDGSSFQGYFSANRIAFTLQSWATSCVARFSKMRKSRFPMKFLWRHMEFVRKQMIRVTFRTIISKGPTSLDSKIIRLFHNFLFST